MKPGTKITAIGKSLHAGHKGIVVADYINMLLVEAVDQSYLGAHTNSTHDKKCFQVDSRWVREDK